jgi:protein phosphatase 1 regulatory subunit 37
MTARCVSQPWKLLVNFIGVSYFPPNDSSLARAVRTSSLRNISLRHNRINATGAVAIALMIKDYPDIVPQMASSPSPGSDGSLSTSPTTKISDITAPEFPKISSSPIPRVPPRHPVSSPYTTYTPYVPRSRSQRTVGSPTHPSPLSPMHPSPLLSKHSSPLSPEQHHVPIITSSPQGGVTTRHPVPPVPESQATGNLSQHNQGPSVALLDKVRALDTLPRLGALQTLDLRGNDLRVSI